MDITEIELEILELEEKLKKTRNTVEKADAESKIAILKQKIRDEKDKVIKKSAVLQKDVPVVMDHKDKNFGPGRITNTGNTFTVSL